MPSDQDRAGREQIGDEDLAAVFIPTGRDESRFLRRYSSRCLADAPSSSTTGRWVCVRLKGHEGDHG